MTQPLDSSSVQSLRSFFLFLFLNVKTQAKASCSQENVRKDQRFNRQKFPSRRGRIGYIKSYYICYTPVHIKVPVAFRRLEVEKVILWFNNYFILSGTQEKKIKQHIKLVNGGRNALIFFSFLANTYIKLILFGVMLQVRIYCLCVYTHICDMYVYIHTHNFVYDLK